MPKKATVEQYQAVKMLLSKGLSQQQIALATGTSQGYVSNVKNGYAKMPDADAMAGISGSILMVGQDGEAVQVVKFTQMAMVAFGDLLKEESLEAACKKAERILLKLGEQTPDVTGWKYQDKVAHLNRVGQAVEVYAYQQKSENEYTQWKVEAAEREKEWRRKQSDPEWLAAEAAKDAALEQERMSRPPPPIEQFKPWSWILEQDATHPAVLRYLNEGNDPVLRYAIQMTLGSVEWEKVKEWRNPPYLKAIDSWERQIRLRPHWVAYAHSLSPTEGAANDSSATGVEAQPPQTVDPALEEFLERVASRDKTSG